MSRRRQSGCVTGLVAFGVLLALGVSALSGGRQESGPPAVPPGPIGGTEQAMTPPARRSPRPSAPSQDPADIAAARGAVDELPVKGRAPLTDYDRAAFGTAWSDTNDNGCDTRNDILRRDLRDKVVEDCVVLSGVLDDPYSGETVDFVRGPVTSLDVQIDHVVALANAWQTGAAYWTATKRERFANDRRNLLAVRGDLNMQKGDGDAATWLPPRKAFRCAYVAMQILTKQRYGLWVTAAENAAMRRVLSGC